MMVTRASLSEQLIMLPAICSDVYSASKHKVDVNNIGDYKRQRKATAVSRL